MNRTMRRPSVHDRPAFLRWAYEVPPTGGPRWEHRAACLTGNPETWWPVSESEVPRAAVTLCAGCPVLGDCREAHAAQVDAGGVWFGTTPDERRRHRNPETWWPVSESEVPRAAVTLCAGCPVLGDCREAHAAQVDAGGVWFGTTPDERRRHRNAARRRAA